MTTIAIEIDSRVTEMRPKRFRQPAARPMIHWVILYFSLKRDRRFKNGILTSVPCACQNSSQGKECRNDSAAFAGQDVVSAACCGRVHGLHSHTRLRQGRQPSGWGKSQAGSSAKYDQFGFQECERRETLGIEFFKTAHRPGGATVFGVNHQRAFVALAIDGDPSSFVGADERCVELIGL